MLDHLSLATTDIDRAARFYDAVLAPLGVVRVCTYPDAVGYGYPGEGDRLGLKLRGEAIVPGSGFHVAFAARSRAEVDGFHRAAIAHAGVDRGGPALRPKYGPGYYAAFVSDPDGHHLEAVFHEPG